MMCGSPHGKMTSKVFGGVLIIVGILWWFTNYGLWILVLIGSFPVLVILLGLWKIAMSSCGCEKCKIEEPHK